MKTTNLTLPTPTTYSQRQTNTILTTQSRKALMQQKTIKLNLTLNQIKVHFMSKITSLTAIQLSFWYPELKIRKRPAFMSRKSPVFMWIMYSRMGQEWFNRKSFMKSKVKEKMHRKDNNFMERTTIN